MSKLLIRLLLVSLASTVVIGCRLTYPVHNVDNVAIVSTVGKRLTHDQVKEAITHAGAGLGWKIRESVPGHIVATLYVRNQMAMVDIRYNVSSYSITYRHSDELNYDGINIHQNYNSWIQNLKREINNQINMI